MKKLKIKLKKKRSLQKIFGTLLRPRLSIFRSNKHIYAQLIDDQHGCSLAFSSTLDKTLFSTNKLTANKEASFLVGQDIAQKANLRGINKVIFDRGIRPYHGRIQSLAEGAREKGLIF